MKTLIKIWLIDLQAHVNFVIKILINLFCCWEKELMLMNKYIAGKNLMKHHCLIKKLFIVV